MSQGKDATKIHVTIFRVNEGNTKNFTKLRRALRHGHGEFSRSMHWLDGEKHDWVEVFACTLMAAPVQATPSELTLTETCVGPNIEFTNTYAVSPKTRDLIRTDQWVSPGLGQIKLETR